MGRNEPESGRERDEESGRFTEEYPPEVLVAAIRDAGGAAGTQEVAAAVGCSYETAYKKLRRLEDAGEITHRKVGNARLWEVEEKNGSKQVFVYVPENQHRRWLEVAEQRDMGMSEFVCAHVEAGLKKFDREVKPEESARELRQQRNELRDELDHARQRIQELEDRLYRGEPAEIERFVTENPGSTYDEIANHITKTVPSRVTRHLDDLEGDTLRIEDGAYYPTDDGDEDAGS